MFKNYFIIAYRQILKNKLFSFINIGGLAVGLAACILISLFVQYEYSYDQQWQNKEHIFQVNTAYNYPDVDPWDSENTAGIVKPELDQYFSEQIINSARVRTHSPIIQISDNLFEQSMASADASLADILSLEMLQGNLKQTLQDPNSIALSASLAQKLFGSQPALNQLIEYQNHNDVRELKVTAIYQDISANSVYSFPALIQLKEQETASRSSKNWESGNYITLLKLKTPEQAQEINQQLERFISQKAKLDSYWTDQGVTPSSLLDLKLQPISQQYISRDGKKEAIYLYQVVALLVLLIACFNFMNLSLSRSTRRLKEVSLRKSMGATQSQVLWQFISETFLLAAVALLLALALVELLLPWYSAFWGKELVLNYTSPQNLAVAFGLLSSVSILAGLYPAMVMAKYKPAQVLTANHSSASGLSLKFRNLLVIVQFSVSICLIICAAVIYSQVSHSLNMDRGYDKEQLLILHGVGREPVAQKQERLKQEILKLPIVESATYIGMFPATQGYASIGLDIESGGDLRQITIAYRDMDFDFAKTFNQQLLAGRFFSNNYGEDRNALGTDETSSIVINESAISHLGLNTTPEETVGKLLNLSDGGSLRIVGIVADSFYRSVKSKIEPEMYIVRRGHGAFLTVKFRGSSADAEKAIKQFWHEQVPELPFVTTFVEDLANVQFRGEKRMAAILFSGAVLASIIACLGLFGLATFNAERRTKEIGIRKVHGATVREIVSLLLWQFSKPVFLACALGSASAVYFIQSWLEQFPYRVGDSLVWLMVALACLCAIILTLVSVTFNTVKVAKTNPIKALRYE